MPCSQLCPCCVEGTPAGGGGVGWGVRAQARMEGAQVGEDHAGWVFAHCPPLFGESQLPPRPCLWTRAPGLGSVRRERRDSPPGNAESELNPRPRGEAAGVERSACQLGLPPPSWRQRSAAPARLLLRARQRSAAGKGCRARGHRSAHSTQAGSGEGAARQADAETRACSISAAREMLTPNQSLPKAGFSQNRHPRTDASPPPG